MSDTQLIELVRGLDEATIRERLAQVEGERDALRVLLRSAMARHRARRDTLGDPKPRNLATLRAPSLAKESR